MARFSTYLLIPCLLALAACSSNPAARHEVACVGGTLAGAAIGGAIGNRFGGGRGQTLMTAAGVAAGAAGAATSMNCVR